MFIRKKTFQEMEERLDVLNRRVAGLQLQLGTVKAEKELLQGVYESTLKDLSKYKEQLEHKKKVNRERQRRYRENHKAK